MILDQRHDLSRLLRSASFNNPIGVLRSGDPTDIPQYVDDLLNSAHAIVQLAKGDQIIQEDYITDHRFRQQYCIRRYSGYMSRMFLQEGDNPLELHSISPVSAYTDGFFMSDLYTHRNKAHTLSRIGGRPATNTEPNVPGYTGSSSVVYDFGAEFRFRYIVGLLGHNVTQWSSYYTFEYLDDQGLWQDIDMDFGEGLSTSYPKTDFRAAKIRIATTEPGSFTENFEFYVEREDQTFLPIDITHMVVISDRHGVTEFDRHRLADRYESLVLVKDIDFRLSDSVTGSGKAPLVQSFSIRNGNMASSEVIV